MVLSLVVVLLLWDCFGVVEKVVTWEEIDDSLESEDFRRGYEPVRTCAAGRFCVCGLPRDMISGV